MKPIAIDLSRRGDSRRGKYKRPILQLLHHLFCLQINDIHRLIAREIAKDEQSFNNAARQNEEFIRKEKEVI